MEPIGYVILCRDPLYLELDGQTIWENLSYAREYLNSFHFPDQFQIVALIPAE